ncbi:MAG: YlxR family protein, partial [Sphingomonas sp.]
MRTRHNDTVGDSIRPLPAGEEANAHGVQGEGTSPHPVAARLPLSTADRGEDDSIRSCILTRDRASPGSLVRLALAPDGAILPDVRAKAPGR